MPLQSDFQLFNPNVTKYYPENALALAKAAHLAYECRHGNRIQATTEQWGFDTCEVWDRDGTQSYLALSGEAIIAVFCGTNERIDWLSNLTFRPLQGPVGTVHRGFMKALECVWPEMVLMIDDYQQQCLRRGQNPPSLWITGHSLGAALATLAVAKLRMEEDRPVNGLYTYGSPRVGDRIFARNFNQEFVAAFRFVNNTDIVTRAPARIMLYSHVGNFLYLDQNKALHDDIHWWYQFLDTSKGVVQDLLDEKIEIGAIRDHRMTEYLAGLETNRAYNPYFFPSREK
jgi:triacylglycerol lipase